MQWIKVEMEKGCDFIEGFEQCIISVEIILSQGFCKIN